MRALTPRHNIRCGIVMINSTTGEILTVCEQKREDLGVFILGVPKGVLNETDTSLYACAIREFQEETGIDLARVHHYRLNMRFVFYNHHFHDILVLFVITVQSNIVIDRASIDSYEIAGYAWVSPIELMRIDCCKIPINVPKYLHRLLVYIITAMRYRKSNA